MTLRFKARRRLQHALGSCKSNLLGSARIEVSDEVQDGKAATNGDWKEAVKFETQIPSKATKFGFTKAGFKATSRFFRFYFEDNHGKDCGVHHSERASQSHLTACGIIFASLQKCIELPDSAVKVDS